MWNEEQFLHGSDTESCCSDTENDDPEDEEPVCEKKRSGGLDNLYVFLNDLLITNPSVNNISKSKDRKGNSTFVLDSGCSRHMTPNQSIFESPPETCAPKTFRAANKNTFTATQKGTAKIDVQGPAPLVLPDVLYIPELANTLISISCLDKAGYRVTFGGGQGVITNKRGDVVGTIPKSNGLYRLVN